MKIQKNKGFNVNFMAFRNYNSFASADYSSLISSSYQEFTRQPSFVKNKLMSLDYFLVNIYSSSKLYLRGRRHLTDNTKQEPIRTKYNFRAYSYAKPLYLNQSLQQKYRQDYYKKSLELAAKYQNTDNELLTLQERIFHKHRLKIASWSILAIILISSLWLASGVIGNVR